jgi:hypothetical protein
MSIYELDSEDFVVKKGAKSDILCTQLSGFSLILFYSKSCQYCPLLLEIFRRLPEKINGCLFGIINIQKNPKCISNSQSTNTPIKYVPYIVLYVNGVPMAVYGGDYEIQQICSFITDTINTIMKKQQFTTAKPADPSGESSNPIPPYCLGKPVCNGQVCYLALDKAYVNQAQQQRQVQH